LLLLLLLPLLLLLFLNLLLLLYRSCSPRGPVAGIRYGTMLPAADSVYHDDALQAKPSQAHALAVLVEKARVRIGHGTVKTSRRTTM